MDKEFVQHPTIKNYEASWDGVIRHCRLKKPVDVVGNSGYLSFKAGSKRYYNHRFIYEAFHGEIPYELVVDHIDGDIKNNNISNLQAITQSENNIRGNTEKCKMFTKRAVKSVNVITGEEIIFQSMNSAGKYFDICPASVQRVAEKVTKSAISKKFNQKISFSYIPLILDTISEDN